MKTFTTKTLLTIPALLLGCLGAIVMLFLSIGNVIAAFFKPINELWRNE
jgi:hypothetical protein